MMLFVNTMSNTPHPTAARPCIRSANPSYPSPLRGGRLGGGTFRQLRILIIFLLVTTILTALTAQAQNAATLPQGEFSALTRTGSARVVEVINPLSVKLDNGYVVRLTGLNFPDYDFTGERTGPFALMSMHILRDMLEGQEVEIYQTRRKDLGRTNQMGHALAHLVRKSDGAWVQGALVRLGLALAQTSQRNPEMAAQLYALEGQAREEKIGLWEEERIWPAEKAGDHLNSFAIIEGTIESAAMKKNRVYLNFGGNWRDDFTVSIAPEDRRAFAKAQINPLDWNGAHVRVRGWVQKYNGPLIEIDHPQALEVLDEP